MRGNNNAILAATLGQWGTHTVSDTNANTRAGGWVAISIVEAAVFSTLTDAVQEADSDSPVTNITYPAGLTIYGLFTAVTLTSGVVRCYSSNQQA
jgi:hypothetical protein